MELVSERSEENVKTYENNFDFKFGLIELAQMIKTNPNISIRKIRNQRMLIKYLLKTEQLVGLEIPKKHITEIVWNYMQQESAQGTNANLILTGPPGIGKTTLGIYYAKILYALGCLEGSGFDDPTQQQTNASRNTNRNSGLGTGMGMNTDNITTMSEVVLWVTVLFLVYVILSGIIPPIYELMGAQWFFAVFGTLLFLTLFVWGVYYMTNNSEEVTRTKRKQNRNQQQKIDVIDESKKDEKIEDNQNPINNLMSTNNNVLSMDDVDDVDDDVVIKIISREDLVELYSGWSAKQAQNILKMHIGKVVFIDEAYSLLNSSHSDPFGTEVLNTLNKNIGELEGKVTVVMAGYAKKMKHLMKAQPGLKRRFMLHVRCKKYTGEQLAKIYELQLAREGFVIKDAKIRALVAENKRLMPNQGGDTKKLATFCIGKYNMNNLAQMMHGQPKCNDKVITMGMLKPSLVDLKNNNGERDDSDDEEDDCECEDILDEEDLDKDVKKFMNMFQSYKANSSARSQRQR